RLADAGLGDTVLLLGQRRDVPHLLAASDVLLLTSDWEGTPNVLLEAQHCGCVPVATDAGGTREAVRPGETGLLVGRDGRGDAVRCALVAGYLLLVFLLLLVTRRVRPRFAVFRFLRRKLGLAAPSPAFKGGSGTADAASPVNGAEETSCFSPLQRACRAAVP